MSGTMRCLLSKMPRRVGHWLNGTRPASTSATSNVTLNDFSTIDKGAIAVVSKTNEIHFNLAFEHYLMDVVKPRVALFFWWQNASTVVIGRHQNAWKECDLEQMAKDKVDLARRFSGGGAVYQDLGNSCFTFLIPDHLYQQSINNAIILNVLKKTYNIHGEPSGRNDLVVNEKKFSGSAFKHVKGQVGTGESGLSLHHGTLLIDTDFSALQKYLTPHKLKLQSKGINSVVSRVVNLKELAPSVSHEGLEDKLIEEFQKQYAPKSASQHENNAPPPVLVIEKTSSFTQDERFQSVYNQLRDWDWRFGKTPEFSHRIEERLNQATVDLNIDVKDGKIRAVKFFTDSLIPEVVPTIETALLDTTYTLEGIDQRFDALSQSKLNPDLKAQLEGIRSAIKKHIAL